MIEGVKKTLFILALLLCPLSGLGQTGAIQGTSTVGGISATTQGAQSSNKLLGVIPAAKISIYLTGTQTLATLTSDGTHSLSNPFYSNASNAVNPGGYIAFASTNTGYDVVASSGQGTPNCTTGPLCYTLPVTLCKDCFASSQFCPLTGCTMTGPLSAPNIPLSVTAFGAVGDGTTDDTTALNAALTYELTNSVCLYFPAGIYKYISQLTWNSPKTLCMSGVSQKSFLYYAGSGSVGGAFYAHYSTGWTQVDIRNMGFLANTNAAYAFQGLQVGGISTMDTVMFLGGNTSSFEGDFWNAQGDLRNLSVGQPVYTATGLNLGCVNGLTFARGLNYPSVTDYFGSGQFTLTMPTVEGCSGIALNMSAAELVVVNGGQLSANHQNILDANNATAGASWVGNVYNGVLSEAGTVPDQIYLSSHFEGSFLTSGVQTYNASTFNGTQFAGTFTAETGTFAPSITNSDPSTIVDNSLDGIQEHNNINPSLNIKLNNQQSSYSLPPSQTCVTTPSHYTYHFNGSGSGTYAVGTVPYTGAGGKWEAWVKGAFYDDATSPGVGSASVIELTQANPTITFTNGATLTLAVSSSGLSATLSVMSGGTGMIGVMEVDFYPGTVCGYQQPANSMTTQRPINAVGGVIVGTGGNTVYRCLTAGTLPIGALTTVTADCGTSTDTLLKTQ